MGLDSISGCLVFFSLLVLSDSALIGEAPLRLEDGLLVETGDVIAGRTGDWMILVTLDLPRHDRSLLSALQTLQDAITSRATEVGRATTANWVRRINIVRRQVAPIKSRTKRSPFDFVGSLSNKLFGTATEEEVNQCRTVIREAQFQQQKTVHVVNELISVVNHTQDLLQETRQRVNTVQRYLVDIGQQLDKKYGHIEKKIIVIQMIFQIEQSLTTLERLHEEAVRQQTLFQRQKAALEYGRLTEEILPPTNLNEIQNHVTQQGFVPLREEWYYSHVHIEPMWGEPSTLVYRARLPFVDSRRYVRYFLQTWPMPLNDTYAVQVHVAADIAFDTVSGEIFQPQWCQGSQPSVCRTGAVFNPEGQLGLGCERGIITNNNNLRANCNLSFKEHTATLVAERTPGHYVIASVGESYETQCVGEKGTHESLSSGVYAFSLKADCWMQGKGWKIRGIATRFANLSLHHRQLSVPPLGLLQRIPVRHIHLIVNSSSTTPLKDIERFKLNSIPTVNPEGFNWSYHGGYLSWFNISMFIIIVVIAFIVLRVIWLRCRQLKSLQPHTESENVPLERVQTQHDQSPPTSRGHPTTTWDDLVQGGRT